MRDAAAEPFRRLAKATTAAALVLAAATGVPGKAHALTRLSSQFIRLNGDQPGTFASPFNNATGGAPFYDVTVAAPGSANVLYVSVSGTGDLNGFSNALLLACLVDGTPCNLSRGFDNSGPTGWTVVQTLTRGAQPNAFSDQNFNYSWCVPITPSPLPSVSHSVQLRFASKVGRLVFIEQIYVNVDSEKITNSSLACTQGSP